MATSSIRLGDNDVFVFDHDIGEWIKAMTDQFDELIIEGKDIEWLLVECNRWCEVFENYPPGLKDIELDDVLSVDAEARKKELIYALNKITTLQSSEGYNLVAAKKISIKVLRELLD
jgi:hypothetical protein